MSFLFKKSDEQAYWYAIKDGDKFVFIMFVTAFKSPSGDTVARYEKAWKTANRSTIQQFVDNFCQNATFKAKWQTDRERIVAIVYKSDALIQPKCAQAIARLNSKRPNQHRFKDFLVLKPYGQYKVFWMKPEVLKDLLSESQPAELTAEIGEARVLQVLRWIKRGLNPDTPSTRSRWIWKLHRMLDSLARKRGRQCLPLVLCPRHCVVDELS